MAGGEQPVIPLSPELYAQVCAFVRIMANTCRRCVRSRAMCSECDLSNCRNIEASLLELRKPVAQRRMRVNTPSLSERFEYYLEAVRKAGRRLTAHEIDPKNSICGRGLKYWTLRQMTKRGILKTYCDGGKIYFATTNKETNKCESQHSQSKT